ncbi:hypothetical protein JTT01_08110 [Clostridium botulinum]|nr:hypothetical protein [Clostridium botulinum]
MGYTALYREWRPRTFKEVVGQKHITVTLKNQVIEKRIAHAYLFVEQEVQVRHLQQKYYQKQ